MIGEEMADEAVALLSTAIGEMAEDIAGEAIILIRRDDAAWRARAERLQAAGEDIALLSRAISVLLKRSRP